MKQNNHLTFEKKIRLEELLTKNLSISQLTRELSLGATTVIEEIKKGTVPFKTHEGEIIQLYKAERSELITQLTKQNSKNSVPEHIVNEIERLTKNGLTGKELVAKLNEKFENDAPSQSVIYRYMKSFKDTTDLAEKYYQLGMDIYYSKDNKYNARKKFDCFEKAAKLGHVEAQFQCGMMLQEGIDDVRKDTTRSLQYYVNAAKSQHADAIMKVAYFLEFGIACKQNADLSTELYSIAAHAGSVYAMLKYAECLELGLTGWQNITVAFSWYQKAADLGNFYAKKWVDNHKCTIINSSGANIAYTLEEYNNLYLINLQRNNTFEEVKTAIENGLISDVLTDDEIMTKIDQLTKVNVLLPIDSKSYFELYESVKTK